MHIPHARDDPFIMRGEAGACSGRVGVQRSDRPAVRVSREKGLPYKEGVMPYKEGEEPRERTVIMWEGTERWYGRRASPLLFWERLDGENDRLLHRLGDGARLGLNGGRDANPRNHREAIRRPV